MNRIRSFQNTDLPALVDVWIKHWSAVGPPPAVSMAVLELAILGRTFFDPSALLVAFAPDKESPDKESIVAWCHYMPLVANDDASTASPGIPQERSALVCAICFAPEGLEVCDELLSEAETRIADAGFQNIVVGPSRNTVHGYTGLSPLGPGIGVPVSDSRTGSLLSRHGYTVHQTFERMVVTTSPYRAKVDREAMQLRRTTQVRHEMRIPKIAETVSAMSHLDIEHHELIDHQTRASLADVELWCSDPEAQVMNAASAILNFNADAENGLSTQERFLIGSIAQLSADRRIFRIETAVASDQSTLIEQLKGLQFQSINRGQSWQKALA